MPENPSSSYESLPEQNLALIRIYTVYRLLLALVLLGMYLLSSGKLLVGGDNPILFLYTTGAYIVFNALTLVLWLPLIGRVRKKQLFFSFVVDIFALTLVMHASGGVGNGLGMLLVVTVAACSVLLSGQIAIAVAAMCTIAVIGDTTYLVLRERAENSYFLTAGLLGVLYFGTSVFLQYLSRRIRSTQQLAQQRARDINRLQQLNEMIVQRMRTGILVVDGEDHVQVMNEAAAELLELDSAISMNTTTMPSTLPAPLKKPLAQWRQRRQTEIPPFRPSGTGPELLANFTALGGDSERDVLIFIEDNSLYQQRAQQIKLAALGRLAASIAHEIRNPLGAISHAAQLLGEGDSLHAPDQRLAQIIQNHSVRMNRTVENVLQLSRREVAKPSRLDLNGWLRQFVQEFTPSNGGEVTIELNAASGSPEINVDPSQLQQVLANLVENAARYSRRVTGTPLVHMVASAHPQSQLPVLDVIDEGPGVSEENQPKLFEPFFTTENDGNGLGLFISRELCEANQARLDWLRTPEGKSCFRISFAHPDRKPGMAAVE